MHKNKSGPARSLAVLLAGALIWTLCLVDGASAQRRFKPDNRVTAIDAGTTIPVRTNEDIEADNDDGRIFNASVDRDVIGRNGLVAIPEGSAVELVVRQISDTEMALDLESITVNNQRYVPESETNTATSTRREGLGTNKRTGKYVGGGALLGAIIGGIAGGGKGALIGAGVGAAGGAGVQVATRGDSVSVPAESLLTFRLRETMRVGSSDNGFTRNGIHYHPGYSTTEDHVQSPNSTGSVRIGADNTITWQSTVPARIYVVVDTQPRKLFASGDTGTQSASWISPGHRYTFVMVDQYGNEIDRDVLDLR
jgi:hypothetical protein